MHLANASLVRAQDLRTTSGVVDALLWTTAHDYPIIGSSLAEYSAGGMVTLIGRNEGGLTLTRDAIHVVLNSFHDFWNTTSTHWRVKSAAKAPVKKIVGKAQPIVDMVISDANKPFVVEHESAIDDLVQGLLVDNASPRRTQDGAGKLQEICALVLQNLALSDVDRRGQGDPTFGFHHESWLSGTRDNRTRLSQFGTLWMVHRGAPAGSDGVPMAMQRAERERAAA